MADEANGRTIRQREAFPKLNIVAAKAAVDGLPAAVCVYTLNDRMVGQVFIPDSEDDHIISGLCFYNETSSLPRTEIRH